MSALAERVPERARPALRYGLAGVPVIIDFNEGGSRRPRSERTAA